MSELATTYSGFAAVEMPLLQWARCRSIPDEALLEGIGLERSSLDIPNFRLRSGQRYQLLRNLLRLSSEAHPGLQIGSMARLEYLGVFGLMMFVAPTVGDALGSGARYASSVSNPGYLLLEHSAAAVRLRYLAPALEPSLVQYLVDDCFASVSSFLRTLLPDLSGEIFLCARFPYAAPRRLSTHRRCVSARKLRFDCEEAVLELPGQLLERKPPLANRFAYEQCLSVLDKLLGELRETSARFEEARALMESRVGDLRTLDDLAMLMGLSRRSLQRIFASHGSGFSELLAASRSALAQELLRNPALSVADVAPLVGYSDVPNFRRAFLGWTGVTPAAFRASWSSANVESLRRKGATAGAI